MAGRPAWQANQPFAAGWKQPAPQSTLAPAAAEQLLLRSKKKAPVPKQDLTPRGLASSSSASLKPTNFLQRNVSAASLAPRRSAAPGPPSPLTTHPHLTTHHSPFTVTVTAHRSPLTVHPNPHPKQEPTDGAEDGDEDEEDEDDEEAVLGMWGAVFWLAVITVSA